MTTRPPELPVAFDARHRPLFQTPSWCVLLHRNQWNLGRCIVVLRTRAIDDPLALTFAERDELWSVVLPRLSAALTAAFAPDRLNYAHLANRQRHVHWHVVPRYAPDAVREVAGVTFRDRRPGRMFRSSKAGRVPRDVREAIARQLLAHLPHETGLRA
ncbi:MAG: HIT family protein [Solirubrobacteraceae bacterium]